MPIDNNALAALAGLGKGGHHHHHHRWGGGGGWGPGWGWGPWWPEPVLVAEDIPGLVRPKPDAAQAIRVYKEAIHMKESVERGTPGPREVYNGPEAGPQIVPEGHLPKASSGYMWVFHTGESRSSPSARGRFIMYVRSS